MSFTSTDQRRDSGTSFNLFSSNLRFLRKRRGLNQEDISALFKKKANTVGNWENGKTEPSIPELLVISGYFGVNLEDLLRSELRQQQTDSERQLSLWPEPVEKALGLFSPLSSASSHLLQTPVSGVVSGDLPGSVSEGARMPVASLSATKLVDSGIARSGRVGESAAEPISSGPTSGTILPGQGSGGRPENGQTMARTREQGQIHAGDSLGIADYNNETVGGSSAKADAAGARGEMPGQAAGTAVSGDAIWFMLRELRSVQERLDRLQSAFDHSTRYRPADKSDH